MVAEIMLAILGGAPWVAEGFGVRDGVWIALDQPPDMGALLPVSAGLVVLLALGAGDAGNRRLLAAAGQSTVSYSEHTHSAGKSGHGCVAVSLLLWFAGLNRPAKVP